MPRGLGRATVAVGAAVGVILIGIFALRMDWREFREAVAPGRRAGVVAGAGALLATISVRGVRWLAVAGASVSALSAYWNATVVGYVGSALYPGRAGEVLRIAALHHAIRVPPGEALASALMDRMADVV